MLSKVFAAIMDNQNSAVVKYSATKNKSSTSPSGKKLGIISNIGDPTEVPTTIEASPVSQQLSGDVSTPNPTPMINTNSAESHENKVPNALDSIIYDKVIR